MNAFSFRPAPTYRAASPDEQMTAAFDMPMSLGATLGQQIKGGVLDSFGLGTAIRGATTPQSLTDTALRYETPDRRAKRIAEREVPAITEDAYKASPYFREGVKWDAGMTEDRAAALAESFDAKRVRDHFASKRPITSFIGNLAGQATDPINYIPILGPTVKAANVVRFGRVGGAAITNALDAAANTAIAGALTYGARKNMGDDITWQSTVSEIAMSALIGGAFGTVSGVLDGRRAARVAADTAKANEALSTLKNVQDARIALNDAIGGLARGEDVSLSANGVDAVQRIARQDNLPTMREAGPSSASPVPDGYVRFYHGGEDATSGGGRWVASQMEYARDYRGGPNKVWYVDVPEDSPALKGQGVIPEEDLAFLGQKQRYNTLELPEELATQMKPLKPSPAVVDQIDIAGTKVDIFGADTPPNTAQTFPRAGGERVVFPINGKLSEGTVFQNVSGGYTIVRADDGKLYLSTWAAMGDAPPPKPAAAVNASPARPDAPPMGRVEAEARIGTADNYKAISEQYRVNPDDGTFIEQADVDQIRNEGRLTPDDEAALVEADATYENGVSYGDALRAVVGCLIS